MKSFENTLEKFNKFVKSKRIFQYRESRYALSFAVDWLFNTLTRYNPNDSVPTIIMIAVNRFNDFRYPSFNIRLEVYNDYYRLLLYKGKKYIVNKTHWFSLGLTNGKYEMFCKDFVIYSKSELKKEK